MKIAIPVPARARERAIPPPMMVGDAGELPVLMDVQADRICGICGVPNDAVVTTRSFSVGDAP